MPMMIWCAVAIEGAIENWPDFGILLALQFINGGVGLCAPNPASILPLRVSSSRTRSRRQLRLNFRCFPDQLRDHQGWRRRRCAQEVPQAECHVQAQREVGDDRRDLPGPGEGSDQNRPLL